MQQRRPPEALRRPGPVQGKCDGGRRTARGEPEDGIQSEGEGAKARRAIRPTLLVERVRCAGDLIGFHYTRLALPVLGVHANMVQGPFRACRHAVAFFLPALAVFVLITSSVGGSAGVSFTPPYGGFSAIRYVHNSTTGGNLTCGVSMLTPAPGRVITSAGEERVKVSVRVAACGGTFSAVDYSGRLGVTSTNFTVPSTGT